MGNLIALRRRIRSAKNISQITKAMEMVSASKMKKAQDQALHSRPFTEKLGSMITSVSRGSFAKTHPLTRVTKTPSHIAILLISTNKGLCGALNVNLHKGLLEFIKTIPDKVKVDIITVGRRARTFVPQRETFLKAAFNELGETVTFEATRAISAYLLNAFTNKTYDTIHIIYPKFITTLKNEIKAMRLLPIALDSDTFSPSVDYQIDGNSNTLINELLPYEVEMTVYQTILEARASEHSARMVAMKNASDNAKELIGNLTLVYNQARQSQVTSELLDVTTARMALE